MEQICSLPPVSQIQTIFNGPYMKSMKNACTHVHTGLILNYPVCSSTATVLNHLLAKNAGKGYPCFQGALKLTFVPIVEFLSPLAPFLTFQFSCTLQYVASFRTAVPYIPV